MSEVAITREKLKCRRRLWWKDAW